jgi:hypothetical protein
MRRKNEMSLGKLGVEEDLKSEFHGDSMWDKAWIKSGGEGELGYLWN